ncbi:uncharacterized protein LOC124326126 isoform X2 [Daphnia pulicaria]|uniref:uncharacterized protein LOC124326126 isoform X2 n=1 Tax=Daphnia pulicaria TaxID=35523 RepID=UPI001EEB35B1|nr:uncharacterized protein LOC124326126 isoform X2 [Daphnia pulicaria]
MTCIATSQGSAETKVKVGDLMAKLGETTKNLTATSTKVVNLNTILFGTNQNLEATSKDLTATKTKLDTISKNLRNTTHDLEVTQVELTDTKTKVGKLSGKLDVTTRCLDETTKDLNVTKGKLENTNMELKDAIRRLTGTTKEVADTKTKIVNLSTELEGSLQNLAATSKDLADTKTEVRGIRTDLQATSKGSAETKVQLGELMTKLSETAKNLTKTNTKVEDLNTILFGTTQTLERTTKDLTDTKTKLEAMNMDLKNATLGMAVSIRKDGTNYDAKAIEAIKEKLEVAKRSRETKSKLESLGTNLNATMKDLTDTKTEVDVIKTDLQVTSLSSSETKTQIGTLATKLDAGTSAASIDRIPNSCKDLMDIGHRKSGLYSVMGKKQIETVYCDFTKQPNGADFQKWIGYEDVKSTPTYFYVQKNTGFSTMNTPIPYEIEVVNTGDAMDKSTGIFTTPRDGTYFFSFTGVAIFPPSPSKLGVSLFLNGDAVGLSFVRDGNPPEDHIVPVTLQSTLKLKAGDKIWVQIKYLSPKGVELFDDSDNQTHFTGFILQEDISS